MAYLTRGEHKQLTLEESIVSQCPLVLLSGLYIPRKAAKNEKSSSNGVSVWWLWVARGCCAKVREVELMKSEEERVKLEGRHLSIGFQLTHSIRKTLAASNLQDFAS